MSPTFLGLVVTDHGLKWLVTLLQVGKRLTMRTDG